MQLLSILAAAALLCTPGAVAKRHFEFYDLKTPLAGPCDLTTGPDGALWGQTFLENLIFRIDPHTGHLEEFVIPYTKPPIVPVPTSGIPIIANRTAFACVIQPGEDGKIYAATGVRNQFVQMNIKTKKMRIFDTNNPLGNLEPFNDAWRGPKGMFFTQTTQNIMTLFDYKTHKFTDFKPPTKLSGPLGTYLASDGAIWFCEFFGQKIGRLNFTAGTFKEYPVKLPQLAAPAVMRAETKDKKGNKFLWFTAIVGGGVGSINMKTGETKAYLYPFPLSAPGEDTVDHKGRIWYSTINANTLNRLNPATGKLTRIPTPGTAVPLPGGIPPQLQVAIHYGPRNSIWFTELATNRVGRLQLSD